MLRDWRNPIRLQCILSSLIVDQLIHFSSFTFSSGYTSPDIQISTSVLMYFLFFISLWHPTAACSLPRLWPIRRLNNPHLNRALTADRGGGCSTWESALESVPVVPCRWGKHHQFGLTRADTNVCIEQWAISRHGRNWPQFLAAKVDIYMEYGSILGPTEGHVGAIMAAVKRPWFNWPSSLTLPLMKTWIFDGVHAKGITKNMAGRWRKGGRVPQAMRVRWPQQHWGKHCALGLRC